VLAETGYSTSQREDTRALSHTISSKIPYDEMQPQREDELYCATRTIADSFLDERLYIKLRKMPIWYIKLPRMCTLVTKLANREFWVTKLPHASSLVIP
jgi:hypothetical protein